MKFTQKIILGTSGALIALMMMTAVAFCAQKEGATSPSQVIVPGMGFVRMYFFIFSQSKPYMLFKNVEEEGIEVFCRNEYGILACMNIKNNAMFTFFPKINSTRRFVRAVGFSDDKENFPIQEYLLFPEK